MNILTQFVMGIFFSSTAFASSNDATHRPQAFNVNGVKAVFADFTEANYQITYDTKLNKAYAKAEIAFTMPESGYPIFDSATPPTSVLLDGQSVAVAETQTPNGETKLRLAKKVIAAGKHQFTIELPIEKLVSFKSDGVSSAFWTSDLEDRSFLERYLPTNFEFDQVKMTFSIQFIGKKVAQNIYANGIISSIDANHFVISFPDYYTSSSIFFHTVPKGSMDELRFTLTSIDGRKIPAVVYSQGGIMTRSLDSVKQKTSDVFHELEKDYGAFPHPSITVYNAGSGGMEYCGATMTSYSALGHELFHSYFARGMMPANGNSGWMDEALASWRDDGYQSLGTLSGTSGMSSHPYYTRKTDQAAYGFGERFMSYLNGKLNAQGGLKPFMRYMIATRVFKPLFVQDFIKEMNAFYNVSLEKEFETYTFSKKSATQVPLNQHKQNEIHQKMNLEELEKYL